MIHLSTTTVKRLIKDVREIIQNPLESHNIFYKHDEVDMLKGYAMIIGTKGTPYEFGSYFFKFDFPTDYPLSPPVVTFHTSAKNNVVRFNPNLYTCGKVCLSILNTWRGDQWSSCQTISTILLTLVSCVFTSEPFLNEPGMTALSHDFSSYQKIIEFKNLEVGVFDAIDSTSHLYQENGQSTKWTLFFLDIILSNFERDRENIRERILMLLSNDDNNSIIRTHIYNMTVKIDYQFLLSKLGP